MVIRKKHRIIFLTTSTFASVVPIASHYYAYLISRDGASQVRLSRRLTRTEARKINEYDGYSTYRAGMKTERFPSKAATRAVALKVWKKHFPGGVLLLEGFHSCAEPQKLLRGRTVDLRRILERWKRIGGFDHDFWEKPRAKKSGDVLCNEWDLRLDQIDAARAV